MLKPPTKLLPLAELLPAVVLRPTQHKPYDNSRDLSANLAIMWDCVRVYACYFSVAYLGHVT